MNTLPQLLQTAIHDGTTTVIRIADILGKSRQHVYDILAAKTTPTLGDAELIAKEIGCEIVVKTGVKKQKRRNRVN